MKQYLISAIKKKVGGKTKQKHEKQPTLHLVIGKHFGALPTTYNFSPKRVIILKNLTNTTSLGETVKSNSSNAWNQKKTHKTLVLSPCCLTEGLQNNRMPEPRI